MVSLAIASRLVPRGRGRATGLTKGVLVKETQQPTSGLERGAPDLARTPLVRAPVEPRVYRQLFDRERSHRLRAGGHEITNTTSRV
jgi:hypothetical protein